ncbi:hypothetical protein G6F57_006707 [Rhizopus arrhizus]|uniref:PIN domain-containing protein n=1 Tax=Rhizopus oryzae TaxID=64495 RepID=A0A9P6XFZ6_RHIOR|nr:hypothetical protein G6F23_004792 [Rhizopus arrhizus]KAG1423508.1 hypothetical protein G6F58_002789 [Rhizopus delemar]KAG0763813.1 hypothetical protein G6F24_005724 [Rhizopus arrhizus]KAG0794238.1 hypothetical protein G6F21_003011 [Rhizopus arrhizus]KAG0799664.1 hypothetical protein G6F22_003001 [Rhizopus arrhizus]
MGKQKTTRKFAVMKRMMSTNDSRLKEAKEKQKKKEEKKEEKSVRHIPQVASSMFFEYNTSLGPPYHVLVDTNFINFSIQNKLELVKSMMDCLYAKSIPCITDCVLAELEKLGPKYRIALKIARDPRFERLPCTHKGTYADDCLVDRVMQHKCYMVATCDRDLKRRIRKIPGIPIMYIANHKYVIERLPEFGTNAQFVVLNIMKFIDNEYKGAVGKQLLTDLLKNGKYEKVISVGRRQVELDSNTPQDKLEQKVVDFENLDRHRKDFKNVSDVFCCLGTTRADAGSAEKFKKIDQEYVLQSAKIIAEENKDTSSNQSPVHYVYCSSKGANKNSMFLYPKTKGQTEEELKELGFQRVSIMRPGLLQTVEPRSNPRFVEKLGQTLFGPINHFFNLHMVNSVVSVAKAMHKVAEDKSIKPSGLNSIKTDSLGSQSFTFESNDIEFISGNQKQ